jgi:hypothetical protein
VVDSPWARGLAAVRFLVQRRLGLRWPWQKLTVLLPGANSSATLNGVRAGVGYRGVTGVKDVADSRRIGHWEKQV